MVCAELQQEQRGLPRAEDATGDGVSAADSAAQEGPDAASYESALTAEQRDELASAAPDLSLLPSAALGLACKDNAVRSPCKCTGFHASSVRCRAKLLIASCT